MARQKIPERKNANLTSDEMRSAITKLDRRISDLEGFAVESIRKRWDPAVEALKNKVNSTLQEILGPDTVEYHEYSIRSLDMLPLIMGGGEDPIYKVHAGYKEGIERASLKLRALREVFQERVDDSGWQAQEIAVKQTPKGQSRRVFVVHGHDDGLKEAVARYLSKLDLVPIVLHEQPNQGRTIIEKFEHHAEVDFAVVLCTPDDVGFPVGKQDQAKPRARQNVVLELGFFMAALGRQRVCVLHTGDLELPSDYSGVLYLPVDAAGAWRFLLAKEMKESGMQVDLNLAG